MKRISLALFIVLAICTLSCSRNYPIVDRAKQQVEVSIVDHMKDYDIVVSDISIKDLEPIYANDSICLLQFTAAYKDSLERDHAEDFRYAYLLDTFISMIDRKPTYNEGFSLMPRFTKKEIRESNKTVKKNGESVYDKTFGSTYPVQKPFDKK